MLLNTRCGHIRARSILLGACLLLATAATASAGIEPLTMVLHTGGVDYPFYPHSTLNPDGSRHYVGEYQNTYWRMTYDVTTNSDPFIFANIVMFNNTGSVQTYTLNSMLTVMPPLPAPTLMGGSVSGSLTDSNFAGGATLTDAGVPIYRARIDGNVVAGLLNPPQNFTIPFGSTTIGPASFGLPGPSAPGPAVNNTIGIDLAFTLTPGDSASFTSNFIVIPGPPSLAVLGIAAAFGLRRRR